MNTHPQPQPCGTLSSTQRRRHYTYHLTPRLPEPGRTGISICGRKIGDQTAINHDCYPKPPPITALPTCRKCARYLTHINPEEPR